MSGSMPYQENRASQEHDLWSSQTICICGIDPEGMILRCSPYFQNLVSGGGQTALPTDICSLIHPEDRASFLADVQRIHQGQIVMERRMVRMVTPDGRVLLMEAAGEPLTNSHGGGVLLSWWEWSERGGDTFAGETVGDETDPFQTVSNEVERYQEVIKHFTDSLSIPLVLVNPEGRIAHANLATLEFLGYRSYELQGRPVAMLIEKSPDKIKQAMLRFIKLMRTGKMSDLATSWFNHQGEPASVTMSGSVLRGQSGELIGMVIAARNEAGNALLADLEKKNQELVKAYDELKALDRIKEDFLSLVGHELRAPLSNILGYAEFLREWDLSAQERQEFVRIIYSESQRLSRLVNDILDLSRMEAGRMAYTYVRDSVNRVVQAALDSLQPDLEMKNLRLELNLDDQLEPMELDPDRIQQVVTNIVHNAIKFTDAGKSIKVWTEPIEGGVRVAIADHGLGIDPSDADKVFNKFEQIIDINHHSKGAGLGMPIAKQIIEEGHAGKLWFESDGRGRGTIFKFTIQERRTES
jgi:PAS domain S-box-containing protein